MKRPSIFIYQFHRDCIIEAQSLRSPSGISPFPPAHCSVLRFGNLGACATRPHASERLSFTPFGYAKCQLLSNVFWEYCNYDFWLSESLGRATIIDCGALARRKSGTKKNLSERF